MKNVFQISCARWTKASDLVSVEWIATRPDMKSRHHLTCGHHQNMRFVFMLHIIKSILESFYEKIWILFLHSKDMLISFILQETAKETFRVRRDSTGTVSKDNLIQIGVYYQSLNTRMISEEPKYQVTLFETEIIIINDLFC